MRRGQRRRAPGRRLPSGRPLPVLAGVAVVVVVALAVLGWQAWSAHRHLVAAGEQVRVLRTALVAGDVASAEEAGARFRREAADARDAVDGPQWSALRVLPWAGPHVEAAQTVTAAADRLGREVLPAALEAMTLVGPSNLAPVDGRVDLRPVEEAAPLVAEIAAETEAVAEDVAAVDVRPLLGPARRAVVRMREGLEELHAQSAAAATAAELLPPMLGADGPREYVVLAQNNAELRALGGMPGAAVVIRADDGRVRLVEHLTAGEAGVFASPVSRLSAAERALYGTQLGRYFSNVTSTPDFPRAARLARTMLRRSTGRTVDGVASVDPYALQLLLGANGPVRLPDGRRLTGSNTARLLLNDVYRDVPDPEAQNRLFAVAAAAVFDRITSRPDVVATARALTAAAEQNRFLLWSAHPEEQRRIARTTVGGVLRGRVGESPLVGVYLHDLSRAKIDWYQHMTARLRETCEGERALRLTVELTARSPRNAADLPDSLVGTKLPPGHVRTEVVVYAPDGGLVTEARTSQGENLLTTHRHEGLHAVSRVVDLRPRRPVRLEYDVSVPESLPGVPRLRVTPGATENHHLSETSACPR